VENLVTLEELKKRLKISSSDSTYDDLLNSIITGASSLITTYCGRDFVGTTTTTEYFDIDSAHTSLIRLSYIPVIEVIEVVDNGDIIDEDYYYVYKEVGIIKTDPDEFVFTEGLQTIEVTYSYGYESVPDAIKEVALVLCCSMFNKAGSEGISAESMGDYSVTYRDPFYIRYSTEWNLVKDVLDKYKVSDAEGL